MHLPDTARRAPTTVARGMTGAVEFDGDTVTIRPHSPADDRPPAVLRLPIREIGAVEWSPATTQYRGVLRFAPCGSLGAGAGQLFDLGARLAPVEDERAVSFKARQQHEFEAIRALVAARLG